MNKPTAAGPILHLPLPRLRLVAVGNVSVGPAPQMNLLGLEGEKKNDGLISPNPKALSALGKRQREANDRQDGPGDQIPVRVQVNRNHRLDVHDPDHLIFAARAEVEVVLEGDADEVSYRILGLLGQLRFVIPRR